jgi:hypothetical protein
MDAPLQSTEAGHHQSEDISMLADNPITAAGSPAAKRETPLGFMDLPAEIRVVTYTINFRNWRRDGIYDYGRKYLHRFDLRFDLPALATVSRLVRKESMPIFFAESLFVVDMNVILSSNARVAQEDRHETEEALAEGVRGRRAQVSAKVKVSPLLYPARDAIRLRNIRLEICRSDPSKPAFAKAFFDVDMKWTKKDGLSYLVAWTPPGYTNELDFDEVSWKGRNYRGMTGWLREAATDMTKRDGFAGFTVVDLEELGVSFCHCYIANPQG